MISIVAFLVMQGDPKIARKEIQARYNAFDHAVRKRDPSILDGLMTEDFASDTPEGGTINRTGAMASFKGLMLGAQHAKWPTKILSLKIEDKDALLKVESHFKGDLPGQDGKLHATELIASKEETWVHSANGWQMSHSHMLKITMKRDGQLVGLKH